MRRHVVFLSGLIASIPILWKFVPIQISLNIPAGLIFHKAYCLPNCGTEALDAITHLRHHQHAGRG
jgi:hypothetical protein